MIHIVGIPPNCANRLLNLPKSFLGELFRNTIQHTSPFRTVIGLEPKKTSNHDAFSNRTTQQRLPELLNFVSMRSVHLELKVVDTGTMLGSHVLMAGFSLI